jgi:hypothetical protein
VANAELLPYLLGERRVMCTHAALGQLHVEADGGSKVVERVEGSDSGPVWALKVEFITKGEYPCLGVELLGLLQGRLKGKAEHQHATRVALAYPPLQKQGLGALRRATHKEPSVLSISPLDEREEGRGMNTPRQVQPRSRGC